MGKSNRRGLFKERRRKKGETITRNRGEVTKAYKPKKPRLTIHREKMRR